MAADEKASFGCKYAYRWLAACEKLFEVQAEALELPYPGVLPEPAASGKKAFGS